MLKTLALAGKKLKVRFCLSQNGKRLRGASCSLLELDTKGRFFCLASYLNNNAPFSFVDLLIINESSFYYDGNSTGSNSTLRTVINMACDFEIFYSFLFFCLNLLFGHGF